MKVQQWKFSESLFRGHSFFLKEVDLDPAHDFVCVVWKKQSCASRRVGYREKKRPSSGLLGSDSKQHSANLVDGLNIAGWRKAKFPTNLGWSMLHDHPAKRCNHFPCNKHQSQNIALLFVQLEKLRPISMEQPHHFLNFQENIRSLLCMAPLLNG